MVYKCLELDFHNILVLLIHNNNLIRHNLKSLCYRITSVLFFLSYPFLFYLRSFFLLFLWMHYYNSATIPSQYDNISSKIDEIFIKTQWRVPHFLSESWQSLVVSTGSQIIHSLISELSFAGVCQKLVNLHGWCFWKNIAFYTNLNFSFSSYKIFSRFEFCCTPL